MTATPLRIAKPERKRREPFKTNLTAALIEHLKPPTQGRLVVHDSKVPGLCVVLTPTGTATFYHYRKFEGVPERVRLGASNQITLVKARELAADCNNRYAEGVNPRQVRRESRDELKLGELFDLFLADAKRQRERTLAEYRRLFDCHLSEWRNFKLSRITRAMVRGLHKRIGSAPAQYKIKTRSGTAWTRKYPNGSPVSANRTLVLLRLLLNYAIREHGFKGANPAAGLEAFEEVPRERFLAGDEITRFVGALEAEPESVRDFFTLLLLTGCRRGNLGTMRWQDVDLATAVWTIPGTAFKNKRTHRIPLIPAAVEILARRKSAAEDGAEYVFPGRHGKGHLTDPMRAWRGIVKRANLADLKIHDLRRTTASLQAALNTSELVIAKTLGHKSTAATGIYARLQLDAVRASLQAATAAVLAARTPNDREVTE